MTNSSCRSATSAGSSRDWDELRAQTEWAREHGAAVHLDGARLFESATGYGRPLAEIAALFNTVYVSFYKGIGTLHGLWPDAASALSCLRRRPWSRPIRACSGWSCTWATPLAPCRPVRSATSSWP